MAEITFAEALNQAIKEEMRRDESVFLMGESVRGGIYGVTAGLSQEFDERIIDTPLSENGFMGAAVGAAVRIGIDPEQALLGANRRFYGRFAQVERGARERGTTIAEMGTVEKLELWESAKSAE